MKMLNLLHFLPFCALVYQMRGRQRILWGY